MHEYDLDNYSYFQWLQIISSIPDNKENITYISCNANNLLIYEHHLIKGSSILTSEKLISKEIVGVVFIVCFLDFLSFLLCFLFRFSFLFTLPLFVCSLNLFFIFFLYA